MGTKHPLGHLQKVPHRQGYCWERFGWGGGGGGGHVPNAYNFIFLIPKRHASRISNSIRFSENNSLVIYYDLEILTDAEIKEATTNNGQLDKLHGHLRTYPDNRVRYHASDMTFLFSTSLSCSSPNRTA